MSLLVSNLYQYAFVGIKFIPICVCWYTNDALLVSLHERENTNNHNLVSFSKSDFRKRQKVGPHIKASDFLFTGPHY